MANNRFRVIGGVVLLIGAFLAGGWFFSWRANSRNIRQEVESAYAEDGAQWGIFDQIPEEELDRAAQIATAGLNQEVNLPEDKQVVRQDGTKLPSQIALTDISEIAGIAPIEKKEDLDEQKPQKSVPVELNLKGDEIAAVPEVAEKATTEADPEADEESKITMLTAPVRVRLIQNTAQYKAFKQEARGNYPVVNFTKDMLVVLESDSNLPDNIFEIVSAQEKDGQWVVTYRVNVLGLDKKINTHTVQVVNKKDLPVQLVQVL